MKAEDRHGSRRGYAAIGLVQPKASVNVGGVLRAAGCFDVALIAVTGRRYKRAPTDTLAAYRHLPLLQVDDLRAVIPYDCVPVAVELSRGARSLVGYTHPRSAFYIFGPEDGSIPMSVQSWCRDVVYVPTTWCLNLAACVNVVLYDRMAKAGRAKPRRRHPMSELGARVAREFFPYDDETQRIDFGGIDAVRERLAALVDRLAGEEATFNEDTFDSWWAMSDEGIGLDENSHEYEQAIEHARAGWMAALSSVRLAAEAKVAVTPEAEEVARDGGTAIATCATNEIARRLDGLTPDERMDVHGIIQEHAYPIIARALAAEREAILNQIADASEWRRNHDDSGKTYLAIQVADDADLSCKALRRRALSAAIRARGE